MASLIQRAAGMCSGAVLLWHSPQLCAWVTATAAWLGQHAIADTVHWLMGAPAGLKVHTELSFLLGRATLWVLEQSQAVLGSFLQPQLPVLMAALAWTSVLQGLAGALAFLHDICAVLSLPVLAHYLGVATLYNRQQRATRTMWRMMRGKRDALDMLRRQLPITASRLAARRNAQAADSQLEAEQNPAHAIWCWVARPGVLSGGHKCA
eukprot:jgi/Astpho2/8081/Aster-x0795